MAKTLPVPEEEGNVVEEYQMENTRILICDDAFRACSAAEQDEALRMLSQIAAEALSKSPSTLQVKAEEEACQQALR